MRLRFAVVALMVALPGGCGAKPEVRVEPPEHLTLYSIDGRNFDPDRVPPRDVETFQKVPVLGKVVVTDPEARREIFAAMQNGIANSDGTMARCFWPRHAIRTVENGKTVDYVFCFECLQMAIHRAGSLETKATTRNPMRVFNTHLKRAGVPLAPVIPRMTGSDEL